MAFFAIVVVRLIDIQIVRAAEYNEASAGKMSLPATVYAPRGDILDTNGVVLADAVVYGVSASGRASRDVDQTSRQVEHRDRSAVDRRGACGEPGRAAVGTDLPFDALDSRCL